MLDSNLKKSIKVSFQHVKEDIEALEREIKQNREFIISQNEQIKVQNKQIEAQNDKILSLLQKIDDFKPKKASKPQNSEELGDILEKPLKSDDSKGRKGVSLDGYSLAGYSFTSYSHDFKGFQEDLPRLLSLLSKQEFITFMTIFQQEDDLGQVTYDTVAKALKITPGCIRTYVSGLIKKGFPVEKGKYNNKIVILRIPEEIRNLSLKKKLMNTFYRLDPSQRSLSDDF